MLKEARLRRDPLNCSCRIIYLTEGDKKIKEEQNLAQGAKVMKKIERDSLRPCVAAGKRNIEAHDEIV